MAWQVRTGQSQVDGVADVADRAFGSAGLFKRRRTVGDVTLGTGSA